MPLRSCKKYRWILLTLSLCLCFLALSHMALRREQRERAVLDYAAGAAAEFHVPLALLLAVCRTESDFDPNARSEAGACGLMQLLPETFLWLCNEKLCEAHEKADIFDPQTNIRFGSYYLAYLLARFERTETALAAYNAGEGRVQTWLADPALSEDGVTLLHIPFPETEAYVQKAMAAFEKYQEKYPF